MKSFLKYLLATVIGVFIVNIFMLIICMVMFISSVSLISFAGSKSVTVTDNSILKLSFSDPIPDRASDNPLENLNIMSLSMNKQTGLNKILKYIEQAGKDDRIKGIYLDLTEIKSNFGALATIDEIRDALLKFKESGKFIYSYSNLGYDQKSYYLATVADSIFVNPETPLLLTGMSANVSFYKDLLKKIGVEPEVIRVGKFKSAVEPFLQDHMSDANREQVQTYLNSLWGNIIKGISVTRNIPVEKITRLTNEFQVYPAGEFVKEGFFDGTLYEYEMLRKLNAACGIPDSTQLSMITLDKYQRAVLPTINLAKDKIAVIYAQGDIGFQQSATSIGPELAQTIRKAREDKNIKAIVLRVNSPGGSALTSDIIWKEVQLAAQEKPLIASMGNVAASGGYYISCAADTIVADPTTLTGSIGIFGLLFSGEKLIKDKLGINSDVVKTNDHSDFGGGYPLPIPISDRPMTTYERNVMQNYINRGYDTFLDRVSQGRHMTKEEVNEIAQGRVWTGEDALKIGLVDVLGGLNDAIRIAAAKAGLTEYQITELPTERNPLEDILSNLTETVKAKIVKEELGDFYDIYRSQKELLKINGMVARIPYDLSFN
ncbi:signal peptide peptidase SppA [Butyricimonas sp. Marseille-P3923]|uniref:signal peptide peptidase SppA n=1 Tax=Butyricimonas sp. Marseille-P3923 TaxID=1987504 RepID=UPI000C07B280|nr:signal peptide peptidase SppA [Butyricimonas sp. Marseille-P3923]